MVKLLIYDSCMIVKKETVMPICYDVQVIYKKHDSMIVVLHKTQVLCYPALLNIVLLIVFTLFTVPSSKALL